MISKDKKYKTRDGREVEIYATDKGGSYPVHGAQLSQNGAWVFGMWTSDGTYCNEFAAHLSLVEVKPRIRRDCWLLVYPDGSVHDFYDKKSALSWHKDYGGSSLLFFPIDCEHGEGL